MPSNADIIKAITAEATAKGVDVPETDSKNNGELADILSELKKVEKVVPAPPAAAEKPEVKKPPFSIAKGKALTSKRGILGPGDEIKAEDLAGGKDAIAAFVKSGHVVKA